MLPYAPLSTRAAVLRWWRNWCRCTRFILTAELNVMHPEPRSFLDWGYDKMGK